MKAKGAHARLYAAYKASRGIRLTAEEVDALMMTDNAILEACRNIADEQRIRENEEDAEERERERKQRRP